MDSIGSAVFSTVAGSSAFLGRPRFLDLDRTSTFSVVLLVSVVVTSAWVVTSVAISSAFASADITSSFCFTGACVDFALCAFFFFAGVFFSACFSPMLFSSAAGTGIAVSNNEGCTPEITGLGCGCFACSSLICPKVSSLLPTVASTRLPLRLSVFTF